MGRGFNDSTLKPSPTACRDELRGCCCCCCWLLLLLLSVQVRNPSPNATLVLTLSSFATRLGVDVLSVFDGTSTAAPLLRNLSGALLPGTNVASSVGGARRLRSVVAILV